MPLRRSGRERRGTGVREVDVERVVVVVGLNNYESGSLTFWGVNLKSTGDRGVGLFISLGCP